RSELGAALKKTPGHKSDYYSAELRDLAEFLKLRIEETSHNRSTDQPPNVMTGNAAEGRAFFNGAGKCSTCHSPTGDLAGIGKLEGVTIQQRLLFPGNLRGAKPVEVTVT